VVFIGIFMLFSGAAQRIHAFNIRELRHFLLWLLSSTLYTMTGAVCFFNPYLAAPPILIFALAFALIIAGIIRMIIGFRSHYITAHWIIIAGITTTLLGIIVLMGWPADWWILGVLLAVDLIFQDWEWIAFAFGLKTGER